MENAAQGTPLGVSTTELLDLARSAAEEAGQMLLEKRGQRPVVTSTKSSPVDVVTELDRAAETLIRERILATRPGDAILGEEGGLTGAGQIRWVVDPLDGTVNYLHGLPDWSVSVGAEQDGTVLAGAVCMPCRNAVFTAVRGIGAWLQTREGQPVPLRCSAVTSLAEALVDTAFGYDARRGQVQAEVVSGVLPRVRGIRCRGSAAMDLCSVAAGWVDAYYESGLKAWDIAAGALIATEAGAVVGGLRGQAAGPEMMLACAPGIFSELHDLLAGLDAGRPA